MPLYRNAGLVPAVPATAAPLRAVLIVLLLCAVALRRLDWWKLLEHVPRLLGGQRQTFMHAASLGATLAGADDAEELASADENCLSDALRHAAFRVILETATFYGLLAVATACGFGGFGGGDSGENEVLAYLADAFAGGWGEPIAVGIVCACFVAACEVMQGRGVWSTSISATTQARPDPPRRLGVVCVIAKSTA